MTTINDIVIAASTEGYTQRIGCTKNFELTTGFKLSPIQGRAPHYAALLEFDKRARRVALVIPTT